MTTYKKDGANGIKVIESITRSVPLEEILAEIDSVEKSRGSQASHAAEMDATYAQRLASLCELRDRAYEMGVTIPQPESDQLSEEENQ